MTPIRRACVRSLLETIIAFDTTSRNSNLAMIAWAQAYLEGHGARVRIDPSEDKSRANLIATIGPDVPGGIVLSGHSDVVPVDGQPWDTDPFLLSEKDGCLFGRGTADMKGFLACVLAAVPDFAAAPLKRPVHIAMTYDEEVGCLGIRSLVPVLRDLIAPPRLMVIGEPTSMEVATSHKGQHVFKARITGKAAHSSRPQDGVNAVVAAARLIGELMDLARTFEKGSLDPAFDPPYTSLNIGPVSGGSMFNIVSDYAEFDWDMRPVPNADGPAERARMEALVAALDRDLKAQNPMCGAQMEEWAHLVPLSANPGSDGETLAKYLAERNSTTVAAFGTEAGFVQQGLDWPVVVCGPGDIAQAHQANEYISFDQLAASDRFLVRVQDALMA